MTYPQLLASQEISEGQEFFRLFTQLDSSGDAYELDVSAKAFAIGPESDVARVRITYFDPVLGANSFVVSVGDPHLGRVDAFQNQKYPISQSIGHIIVTPEDFLEKSTAFETGSIDANFDIIGFIQPRLDLIVYTSDPRAIPPKRSDYIKRGIFSIHNHSVANFAGTGTTYLFVPYYGRKYASLKILNKRDENDYVLNIAGIVIHPSASGSGGVARIQDTPVVVDEDVTAAGESFAFEVRASESGYFDYLRISLAGPGYDATQSGQAGLLAYALTLSDEEV